MFDGSSAKEIMPARLTKKEYWRPRGTNNEEEDEDEKFHPLKKDRKERQTTGLIYGFLGSSLLSFGCISQR